MCLAFLFRVSLHKRYIKFPFKRKACKVYRVGYGRGRIW